MSTIERLKALLRAAMLKIGSAAGMTTGQEITYTNSITSGWSAPTVAPCDGVVKVTGNSSTSFIQVSSYNCGQRAVCQSAIGYAGGYAFVAKGKNWNYEVRTALASDITVIFTPTKGGSA